MNSSRERLLAPANLSPQRRYRYTLARRTDVLDVLSDERICLFIGLNPSTADETVSDPTCTRELNYTADWGYGWYLKLNLFAFRSTDPKAMKALQGREAIGPDNDAWLYEASEAATIIICAWGTHGRHLGREAEVLKALRQTAGDKLHTLGRNRDGTPKHPLYLRRGLHPEKFCP